MNGDHLDDDALSALLDGEASPEEAAHVEGCDTCAARRSALRAAADAIGSPVPPPAPASREVTIRAALAAVPTSLGDRRSRRLTAPTWAYAAAVLVVLALLSPLVLRAGDGDDDEETAAVAEQFDTLADQESATEMAAAAPPGDLGELAEGSLAERLGPLLGPAPTADSSAAATEEGGGGGAAAGARAAVPCEAELREADPSLGALRVSAAGTFRGRPALVLAFDQPPSILALVVAVDDCDSVLRSASFPAP